MSGNNSLSDSGGVDLPSQYALRVALQTMKERCVALQQRLTTVEEENALLRNQTPIELGDPELQILRGCQSEAENLRKQVEELTRQKLQLTEHIAMVATENRQLWSRLSQLAKEDKQKQQQQQQQQKKQSKTESVADHQHQHHLPSSSSGAQNLIRSRTFTQHSPNPLLRQKHLAAVAAATTTRGVSGDDKSLDDLSLEEISLKDVASRYSGDDDDRDDDNQRKIIDDGKCDDEILNKATTSLGFGYLNDDSSDSGNGGGDLGTETKKCIDNMIDIKKEVLKQQNELTAALNIFKEKKALLQECAECKRRKNNKPEMADKIIETRDDLIAASMKLSSATSATTTQHYMSHSSSGKSKSDGDQSGHIDFLEEKRRADKMDKLCPMCGKIFDETVIFDEFEEHVETHFIDDTDIDPNTFERNFELVSQTVGDF